MDALGEVDDDDDDDDGDEGDDRQKKGAAKGPKAPKPPPPPLKRIDAPPKPAPRPLLTGTAGWLPGGLSPEQSERRARLRAMLSEQVGGDDDVPSPACLHACMPTCLHAVLEAHSSAACCTCRWQAMVRREA